MNQKIKVGAVNYLNTKPLLYGITHSAIIHDIEIILDYPSQLAKKMQEGEIDVALLPVAAIPQIKNARVISDYGIATDGNVASVAVFSQVPLYEIKTVYLDYQSRTSVKLAQLIFEHFWQQDVLFLQAEPNYIDQIKGTFAGVIIGDRALQNLNKFKHVYDLSKAWKFYTGLDFIFAAWIANKDLPIDFINNFNAANAFGLQNIPQVIAKNPCSFYDLHTYYTENIKFVLDEEKRKGLGRFLEMIG